MARWGWQERRFPPAPGEIRAAAARATRLVIFAYGPPVLHYGLLATHSTLRWFVLAGLIVLLGRALWGWLGDNPIRRRDRTLAAGVIGIVDTQLLLGVVLYAVMGPWLSTLLADPQGAMEVAQVRFFTVEHIFGMIVAITILHVSSVRSKRADDSRVAWRRLAFGGGTALVLIVGTIPWPILPYGRPLLRWG